jgi:hypothetical protein
MFHAIEADEGTSATESGLAMDGDRTFLVIFKMVFAGRHKLLHNVFGWG